MRKQKKGQIQQIILLFVVIFTLVVTVLIGRLILTEFYGAVNDANINNPDMLAAQSSMESSYGTFDYGIVVMMVSMIIGLLITSFLIPTHPIFVVINIIGIFILVFLGMVLSNVYGELVAGQDQILGDEADQFVLANYIITHLPYLGAIVIFLTSVVMFARSVN